MNFQTLFRYCPRCGSKQFLPNNEKSCRCADCGFVFYINPSAAVAAFIVNKKGELLVCTRAKEPAKNTLDLPGGFTDYNETAEEALAREVAEELGGTIASAKYLFSLPNNYLYSDLTVPTMDLFYLCTLENDENLHSADDVAEFQFLPLNAINTEKFGLNSVKKAVERFLNYKIK
jgi:ADP-ribose pyrophosphatase YjhB (NUDIX family)